ncbi:hypothetical protein Ct9H90mP29_17980 [bacterium]|nr:MAG: hypothetical protein Ct9H90mP29_17980 [bacterium]
MITAFVYTIVIFRSEILKKRYSMGMDYSLFPFLLMLGSSYGPPATAGESELVFQVVSQKMIVGVFCFSVLHRHLDLLNWSFRKDLIIRSIILWF